MSNDEFQVTVTTTAPTPGAEHKEYGTELMQNAMGLNPTVVEAKMTLMTKHVDGTYNFTTVDFDRSRETQLSAVSRTISAPIYNTLAASFDKLVARDPEQVEMIDVNNNQR